MGVYIKGMGLPPMCEECDISHDDENYYGDIMSVICPLINESVEEYGWRGIRERHPDCPLVEVKTPHGRLIDADAEYKALLEMKVEGEVFVTAVEFAKIEMEQAQTVIEAEVE